MAKLDLHGLNIKGLKKASGETMNYGPYDSRYDEVFYDISTGEVWTKFQCSLGQNSWTEYHDSNIIKICNATSHMTMQNLADAIYQAVQAHQEYLADCQAQKEWEAEIERKYAEGVF